MINFNITIHRWHVVAIIVAMILLKGGSLAYAAWSGPTAAPPGNNVSAPINVGAGDQVKNGGLSLNALAMFGNVILSGTSPYISFGATPGSGGYGIRANNGVMEYKNAGGNWAPLSSSTSAAAQTQLYNNSHTASQCVSAGGTVRTAGASSLCDFSGSSCPAGWTRLASWGSTNPNSCSGGTGSSAVSCTTGSHAFANAAQETCGYNYCQLQGFYTCQARTCTAQLVTVGCY